VFDGVIVFVFGIIIGSFLNVLIYRLPLGISLINPKRSYCPHCNTQIRWIDNIPLISYLILNGKCSKCFEKISINYFIVEFLSGLFFVLLFLKFGFGVPFFIYLALFSTLLVLSFIDFKYKAVPDYLLLIAFILAIFVPSFSFEGALLFAGGFVLLDFVITFYIQNIKAKITKNEELETQKALGEGDIPIVAIIGGILGVQLGLFAIILASILAIIPAIYGQIKHKDIETPFIPFLSLGLILVVLFGENIYEIATKLGLF